MKKSIIVLALIFIAINLYSIDTLRLKSNITDVTVFLDGAQVTRHASMHIAKGKHIVLLEKLPMEINPQSIQLNNHDKGKILSVKHDIVYPEYNSKIKKKYEDKIEIKENQIEELMNRIRVFDIEEKLLIDNSDFGKKDQGSSVAEIREAASFYRVKLNEIKSEKLKLYIRKADIKDEIKDLYAELNKKLSKVNKVYSTILFTIESKVSMNIVFDISYYLPSAGWLPIYDFRVDDIDEPLSIIYNATIFQSTGEDWKNVNLVLSNTKPSLTNEIPKLKTWNIQRRNHYYNTSQIKGNGAIEGKVIDASTKEPIPFANVVLKQAGKMISGASTDFNGNYKFKPVAVGYYEIEYSFIGYLKKKITSIYVAKNKTRYLNTTLQASTTNLEEFVIERYNAPLIEKDQTSAGGRMRAEEIRRLPARSAESVAVTVGGVYSADDDNIGGMRGNRSSSELYIDGVKVINYTEKKFDVSGYEANSTLTNLEYNITIPYSIPSDGNDYDVMIKEVKLPVNYVYRVIPKIEMDVFFIAEIKDWNKLNLLSGKSSIYYKGTYTGESVIDDNNLADTLSVSLNRDKNIIVERTLVKEVSKKQFIGKNVKETMAWRITIKNNKDRKIKIFVEDQIPISELKDIEIELLESSNAKVDYRTGKVVWEIELNANEKKELLLKYLVKYPNYVNLWIE